MSNQKGTNKMSVQRFCQKKKKKEEKGNEHKRQKTKTTYKNMWPHNREKF